MMKTKVCPTCKQEKSLAEYARAGKAKTHRCYCRSCFAKYMRQYRAKLKERDPAEFKRREKNSNLSRYGITLVEYESMLEAQEGVCAICKTTEPDGRSSAFHVDHCHVTNVVRGLLCHSCNTALGGFRESPAILEAAKNYLLRII